MIIWINILKVTKNSCVPKPRGSKCCHNQFLCFSSEQSIVIGKHRRENIPRTILPKMMYCISFLYFLSKCSEGRVQNNPNWRKLIILIVFSISPGLEMRKSVITIESTSKTSTFLHPENVGTRAPPLRYHSYKVTCFVFH